MNPFNRQELTMHKKSNLLLAIGVAAFLVGAALVVGVLRDEGASRSAPPGAVLVATGPIAAGTTGADAIAQELIAVRDVPASTRAQNVLTDTTQIQGRVIDVDVAAGEQLRATQLRPQTLRAATITIPAGMQGVAVQLPFVAGGAGYIGPGDFVNLYGNVTPGGGEAGAAREPITKLVLGNVKVLDVSTEVAPRVTSGQAERPAGSNVTYLLALNHDQAERVIFLAANAQLWIALSGDAEAPVPATAGRTSVDVLQ